MSTDNLRAGEDIPEGAPVFIGGDGLVRIDQCWGCGEYRGDPHGKDGLGEPCYLRHGEEWIGQNQGVPRTEPKP